jgi:hypothetical protein
VAEMKAAKEKILIDLLFHTKDILEEHKVEFWLECGTLLGAVRDGKFIPWEYDLDFGAWSKEMSLDKRLAIAGAFSERGYSVYLGRTHMNIMINGFWSDINFYDVSNDLAIVALSQPTQLMGKLLLLFHESLMAPYPSKINPMKHRGKSIRKVFLMVLRIVPALMRNKAANVIMTLIGKIHSKDVSWKVPIHFLSEFSTITFYEMPFKVPDKMEEYLAYRYGKDWAIPRKDWVTERDDKAVAR